MPTNQDLQAIIGRGLQSLTEIKGHAVQLGQLEREVKARQDELSALDAKIGEAKRLAQEVDAIQQTVLGKRRELAELELVIRQKHVEHGSIDGDLRTLMKRAQKLTEAT